MSSQAVAQWDSTTLFDEVTARYRGLLRTCRDALARDVADAPSVEHLTGYFERGKMIRPILVFLSTAAAGGDPVAAVPAAEAVELLHVASLIHDDIIDQANERRGMRALHRTIGESAAMVVGDYLILRSFDVLARAVDDGSPARTLAAVRLLSRYAQWCCRGQIEELAPASPDSGVHQYFSVVRGKTGSQFVVAATLGGTLAHAADRDIERLGTFGLNVGVAFQIRDDELDLLGDAAVLGKPAGNSLDAGRHLLPLIYLARYGSSTALDRFAEIRHDPRRRDDLVRLLEEEGVMERVRRTERRFLRRAFTALDRLPAGPARDALHAIAVYAVSRDR
jgi:geranylgeranyl pyrophosphate synthase